MHLFGPRDPNENTGRQFQDMVNSWYGDEHEEDYAEEEVEEEKEED